jgi:hypothetical protein
MANLPEARVVRGADRGAPTLGPPPRRVPIRLVWRVWFATGSAGWCWLLAAFGMFATFFIVPQVEFRAGIYDRTAKATVTAVDKTGSQENDRDVYRIDYTFTDHEGHIHKGTSYSKTYMLAGQTREVEYFSPDPAKSRIVGARTKPAPLWVLCVLIFPIIGLSVSFASLRTGRRAVQLLRSGVLTTGTFVGKTKCEGEDNTDYDVEIAYTVDGKRYTITVETNRPELLEDDLHEPLVYDPRDPAYATTLDHLPGKPRIGEDGALHSRPGIAVHVLVMPLITFGLIIATLAALFTSWNPYE